MDEDPFADPSGRTFAVVLPPEAAGVRLDKALADYAPAVGGARLSRARLQALMAEGSVRRDGGVLSDPSAKAVAGGTYLIATPPLQAAAPEPQNLPLNVLFEDDDIIVIDKAAGMAAHPAPGTPDRTLVNALLHHCGASLSGIGGVARPGIVHRLDKDTSGIMVAAKSDAAHQGLSQLFAAHDIDRTYTALVRGAPVPAQGSVTTQLGRARFDRQRMAVLKAGGREAVTHYRVQTIWGQRTSKGERALAARVSCTLETGRTHQIRVHLAYKGAPVLGDPLYGSSPPVGSVREAIASSGLGRQALHAAILGFIHPVSGERLRFVSSPPDDMSALESELQSRFLKLSGD